MTENPNHSDKIPSVYVGDSISFKVVFPDGVARLVFMVSDKASSVPFLEQPVSNPTKKGSVAEFIITAEATRTMPTGIYRWVVYAMNSDGSRNTWFPFSEGDLIVKEREIVAL